MSHRHFSRDKLTTKCPTFSPCNILSQRQNVPLSPRRKNVPLMHKKPMSHWHFTGDKLSQTTKCPAFSPCDKLSQRQNVPFPPRQQNVPLMILLKNHCFTRIFRATNCPKVTKCPTFSPATKCPNLCTYAHESYGKLLGHFVASEKGYWDNLSQVKKATLRHI